MVNRRRISVALIGLVVLVLGGWLIKDAVSGQEAAPKIGSAPSISVTATPASSVAGTDSGLSVKPLSSLPSQVADTWKLIQSNGPFPYRNNDGVVFFNRESVLPAKPSGYYHEYTVKTPEDSGRGARRLVTGATRELFYTADHYSSFVVVDPLR